MRLNICVTGLAALAACLTFSASPLHASPMLRDCKITQLTVTQTRMEIECDVVPERPTWNSHRRHAASLSDGPTKVQAMISLATEAWRSGKQILIHTDTDGALVPAGCNANSCRVLRGVTLK